MKKKNLPLKEIFLEDERFRISYYFSLEKLILSLQKVGLLNPPLVVLQDKRFILVSGWKRVLACIKLGLSSLPVFVIEEKDELKIFLAAFYENLATREFSLLEKAEILSRLKRFGEDEKKIVQYYLPLLDIPSTLSNLESYLGFYQLESEVKRIIHQKNMPFSSVKLFAGFTSQERKSLLPLLLPSGQNKMKEILEDLKEISRRNDIPAKKILSSKEILDIMGYEKLSPLQKADRIRLILMKKRYPALSSRKKSFDSLLKKLRLPKNIMVKPSPFFEEENFSVNFSFGNRKELKTNLVKLQELAAKQEFAEIFKLK
ncbi:MAG: ParB-like nuclease domain-containing protein [Candidatus Aminicenantes bacterium]|nr:ParB-like nuclease domain-containing protein [Candidatus Aminicenantes bacterium]